MTDEAKALAERSETIRSQMYLDLVANDTQHKEMLNQIETQAREIERLRAVLFSIEDQTDTDVETMWIADIAAAALKGTDQ